jgi:hypothetical protein
LTCTHAAAEAVIAAAAAAVAGEYVQTEGLMEQDLMDKMLAWLEQQQQQQQGGNSSQPFFLYYAPNAIHQ